MLRCKRLRAIRLLSAWSKKFYLEKLTDATRLAWVERAISRVTDAHLRVQYVLAGELEAQLADAEALDDPLIQEGLGLGGQIREDTE